MRSFVTKLGILFVSAIFLSSCLSTTTSYNQNITSRFNNSDFAFLKKKYPMVLNAKGVPNNDMRTDLIEVMVEKYSGMHRFRHATFASAIDFKGQQEITFVININPTENTSAWDICSEDIPSLQSISDANSIKSAQFAFCRKDKAWSYITMKFSQPVKATSSEFKDAIGLAAHSILYKSNNPFNGCGIPATRC
ncbi:hypothetical protein [Curvivirga aplysinae]|uniref:hypothetical protein n=1 Tax=Curvivirga aplysinae TaxID=2529852 RepID=UPI001C3F7C5A|nr:hypothetical protein [Curvivirga aplysinae]MTI11184.1 hypothetical protein [Curvivirga aplysinae]